MIGRTPSNIQAIRPLKDGVIADFEICEKMLRYFIHRVHQRRFAKPAWSSASLGHHRRRAARRHGGGRVRGSGKAYIIEERWRRHRCRTPIHEPTGNMVVDIGGGTTEVAVISLGGIVASQSIRVGGDELDEALVAFVKKEFQLALVSARRRRSRFSWARPTPGRGAARRDPWPRLVTGLPRP